MAMLAQLGPELSERTGVVTLCTDGLGSIRIDSEARFGLRFLPEYVTLQQIEIYTFDELRARVRAWREGRGS